MTNQQINQIIQYMDYLINYYANKMNLKTKNMEISDDFKQLIISGFRKYLEENGDEMIVSPITLMPIVSPVAIGEFTIIDSENAKKKYSGSYSTFDGKEELKKYIKSCAELYLQKPDVLFEVITGCVISSGQSSIVGQQFSAKIKNNNIIITDPLNKQPMGEITNINFTISNDINSVYGYKVNVLSVKTNIQRGKIYSGLGLYAHNEIDKVLKCIYESELKDIQEANNFYVLPEALLKREIIIPVMTPKVLNKVDNQENINEQPLNLFYEQSNVQSTPCMGKREELPQPKD
ncbi:hypothetical protein L3V83_05540 [Thiotrichales bacterium 19X7-9]|nr:hypothetical protein [Thiotrichales bacterium 19X7-9]